MQQLEFSSHPLGEAGVNGSAMLAPPPLAEYWGAEELTATLDSVGTGIWALDLEGRCVFINQAACRTLGHRREECLGEKIQCRIHAGHCDGWVCPKEACRVQSALQSGSAVPVDDDVFRRRDGTSIAVKYSIQPVVVEGRMRGSVIAMTDITAQKRAEEAQRKSDEWLNYVQRAAGVGSFEWDAITRQTRASDQQFRLYGLDPAATFPSGEEFLQLLHPGDRDRAARELECAETGASTVESRFRVVWPDGSIHWLFAWMTMVFDDAGKPARLVGTNIDITGRVRAETAFHQFFSASPTPMAIWGLDGRIQRANPSWEPILGFTAAETEGMLVLDRVHPEDRAAAAAEFENLLVSGMLKAREWRVTSKDGSHRWLLLNASLLRDEQVIYVTAYDITDQKRAEEALRESEAKFRELFDCAPVPYHELDMDGVVRRVNRAECALLGCEAGGMLGRSIWEFIAGAELETSHEAYRRKLSGERPLEPHQRLYKRRDGGEVCVEVHDARVRNAAGETTGMRTALLDLTERKRAEEALRVSAERLRRITDSAHDAILMMDDRGAITYWNPAAESIFGCRSEEAIGKDLHELLAPERYREAYRAAFAEFSRTGCGNAVGKTVELVARRKGGGEISIDLSLSAIRLDGEWNAVGIIRDVTERKRAERYQALSAEILGILNEPLGVRDAVGRILAAIKRETGFDAVGIRLRSGDDFPYFVQNGFAPDFLDTENALVARDENGGACRDRNGNIGLECTCGLVLSGQTDPANPLFTKDGSFWTNDSLPLLDLPAGQDPRLHPRNKCIHQGYLSVALIPIRVNRDIVGLLQLNDRKKDRFTVEQIHFFEGISASIGVALVRKQQEDALRENEARHRLLFDGSRDAMMTMAAPSWKFTSANPAALEIFGARDAAEFTALGPLDLSPERQPDGRPSADKAREAIETALREGSLFFEWTHRRLGGADFPATVLITRMEMAGQAFLQATVRDITAQKQAETRIEKTLMRLRGVSQLRQSLLAPAPLEDQLRKVTEAVVGAFDADVCRIWLIRPGDLCERGCPHAEVHEGPHVCRQRDRCLHLLASSVRDTLIDGPGLRRVPFGCYNIGLVASDEAPKVVNNDVQNDPRLHNRAWARELGLVSFGGYQLRTPGEETLGVLALFAKHPILADEDAMLEGLGSTVALMAKRTAAEEALRQSEERLRQIVANAGEGITLVDAEERFEFANPAAETIFGVPPNGLVGRNLREFVGSEELRRVLEETAKRRAGLQSCYELEIRRPDGAMRQILVTAEPSVTGEGQFKGTFAVIRDITERKRAEAALAKEALRRRMVFEQSRDGIVIYDRSGKVRESNQSFANMLGYSLEEMLQLHVWDWEGQLTRDQILKLIGDGKSPPPIFETLQRRKDGSLFDAEVSSISTELHGDVFYYALVRDISARKRMAEAIELHAEKLARSNAELERFAYVASHDLQEPLRMVASFTQLLAKRYSGRLDETADRYINFAVDGARRMQQLIADLLAYSRVNSKELDLRQTECEAVVQAALQNLSAAIVESGAVIEQGPLPVLTADAVQLGQLFQNLIGNAVKFRGQAPPRVHIAAADSDGHWLFSVQDNGIGIDPRHADRIFQIFQRLHTREQYPGTGIGLAVCQKVVERHGGKIWVESEPGVGSTFRFTIPKARMDGVVDDRGE